MGHNKSKLLFGKSKLMLGSSMVRKISPKHDEVEDENNRFRKFSTGEVQPKPFLRGIGERKEGINVRAGNPQVMPMANGSMLPKRLVQFSADTLPKSSTLQNDHMLKNPRKSVSLGGSGLKGYGLKGGSLENRNNIRLVL